MPDRVVLHDDAVRLLRELSGPDGIRASLTPVANYAAVFTRDAVMAGIAGLLTGDSTVSRALVRTLEHLRDLQGAEGQIASNFVIRDGSPRGVSFGSLVPRVDAPLWYVLGVGLAARAGAIDPGAFRESVAAVVQLLDALEYNGKDLIYVPAGGDWADEYILEGYVLHDQVLRAWALRVAGTVFAEPRWGTKATQVAATIERSFWPAAREGVPYPIAAHAPTRVQDIFDLASCALFVMARIAPARNAALLDWIAATFLAQGKLPPAFHPVIGEGDAGWSALARYHLHGFRNAPNEYHNGGIWPIWIGWLALAMADAGRSADVARLARLVREAIDARPFAFEEYLHGVTNVPGGVPRMAYTATGLLFLDAALTGRDLALLTR